MKMLVFCLLSSPTRSFPAHWHSSTSGFLQHALNFMSISWTVGAS